MATTRSKASKPKAGKPEANADEKPTPANIRFKLSVFELTTLPQSN